MHNDKLTMKREIYISVLETIDGKEFDLQNTLKELRTKFPLVRLETLRSILTQQYSKEVKKTFRSQTSELKRKEYCDSFQKYLNGNLAIKAQFDNESAIAASAINNRFSPALIAKIILSEQLNLNSPDYDAKKRVKELLNNTNLIPNGKLAFEVWRACLEDENYGHYSECIKNAVGNEYEKRLKKNLRRLGISYQVSCI